MTVGVGVGVGVGVRVRVRVGVRVRVRVVGVPLALMNEKRPPPCRSEPVATCDAGGRTVDGRTVDGKLWSQCGGADRRAS